MKKLSKIRLNRLQSSTISENEMKSIQGGVTVCGCSCYWASSGGASTDANGGANMSSGLYSSSGENEWWVTP